MTPIMLRKYLKVPDTWISKPFPDGKPCYSVRIWYLATSSVSGPQIINLLNNKLHTKSQETCYGKWLDLHGSLHYWFKSNDL